MASSEEVNKKSKISTLYIYIYISNLVIWKKMGYNLFFNFYFKYIQKWCLNF